MRSLRHHVRNRLLDQEAAIYYVSCSYGTSLARHVQAALETRRQWHLQPPDLMAAMLPALWVFDELNMPSYLGGSIAGSVHGMQQMAQDIDLVVDLPGHTLPSLVTLLQQGKVLNEDTACEGVRARMSFPVLLLDSLMKVDVVLPKLDMFATSKRHSITQHTLDNRYPPIRVASALK